MSVTIATIVRNEADRFLRPALECWSAVSDRIVAVDNGSTDSTSDILAEFGAIVHNYDEPMEGNEWRARSFLWDRAVEAADGGWIVHLDADHVVADDFRPHLEGDRVVFWLYDMWNATHYRSDAWWRARPWWQAVRIGDRAETAWNWHKRGWHSGHLPLDVSLFGPPKVLPKDCAVLHYGYATPELRAAHLAAYEAREAHLTPAELFHARTIADERPNLVELPIEPRWALL